MARPGAAAGGLQVTEAELRDLCVKRLELLAADEFEKAARLATRLRIPLIRALVERARLPQRLLLEQLAQVWGVAFIDLKIGEIDLDALRTVTEEYARAHNLVAFDRKPGELRVAMLDPRNGAVVDDIQRMTRSRVVPFLADEAAIRRTHLLYRGDLRAMLERTAAQMAEPAGGRARTAAEDTSAVDLLDRILEYAAVSNASDIHVEPYELETLVRCRIDGVLHEVLSVAPSPALLARIKILSGMRLDERRAPQDGRFEADLGGLKLDLRVSSLPTLWGEKLVLRVLTKDTAALDLEDLGLSPADHQTLVDKILRPFGMVLITGPTGSGKTTTLYGVLIRLAAERQNLVSISTVEDPVEYTIPRVCQVPVNPGAGIDFANGLRALLRQDPDILMVGEIRDRETADIAVRAALVGRLLISTLHANDATAVVARLLDMGIEPYLLASTLSLVVAQRLVRRLCLACRESFAPDDALLARLRVRPDFEATVRVLRQDGVLSATEEPLAGIRLFRGKGCRQCHDTGFRGRLGIFELFAVDDAMHSRIMERQNAGALRAAAIAQGMRTMFQDGLAKVLLAHTTLDEVFRVAT